LENQKELFNLELEKMKVQHQHEIEKSKVDSDNAFNSNLTNTMVSSILHNPQIIKELIAINESLKKK
jgi:hypothetical protein